MAHKKKFSVDKDRLRKLQEDLQKGGGGDSLFLRIESGAALKVRVLPIDTEDRFFRRGLLHRFRVNGEWKASLCTEEDDCIVCRTAKSLMDSKSPQNVKKAKMLRPRKRFWSVVLDRATDEVKVWGYSSSVMKDLLSYYLDPDYDDMLDPDSGVDLTVERVGQGKKTTYPIKAARKSSPYDPSILDELPNLDELIHPMDEEELEQLMEDFEAGAFVDDDEEEDRGRGKKNRRDREEPKQQRGGRRVADDDEEEDEEEAPRSPTKKKAR